MTVQDLQSVSRHLRIVIRRKIENLLTKNALIVLMLLILHDHIKLKSNVGSPRTGLGVHGQQVTQQCRWFVVAPTEHAARSQPKHNQWILPQLGKIPISQDFSQTICQCRIIETIQGRGKHRCCELGGHKQMGVSVGQHHSNLP